MQSKTDHRALTTIAALALLAALAGCSATPVHTSAVPAPLAVPGDEAGCSAAGGRWQPIGRLQRWTCLVDYPDAGKACSDHSQCHGQCLASGTDAVVGQPLTGTCQRDASERFGCRQPVENGHAGPAICVD